MNLQTTQLDFGYPWWLSYSHLLLTSVIAVLLCVGFLRKWSKGPMLLLGALILWSGASTLAVRFILDFNGRARLPTQNFFPSGKGTILDMGAGTGRSSIMALEVRPQSRLVALDLFGESFDEHFGAGDSPQKRLQRNLALAGVEQRAKIQTGDMRRLPFQAGSFDAIVSAYAIDHLGREGISEALAEAGRVVKPGGDFLLMVIAKDKWLEFTFGPFLFHAGTRSSDWWNSQVQKAGFQVIEQGTVPATLYILARRT